MNRRTLLKGMFSAALLGSSGLVFADSPKKEILPMSNGDFYGTWNSRLLVTDILPPNYNQKLRYDNDLLSFDENHVIQKVDSKNTFLSEHVFSSNQKTNQGCLLDIHSQIDQMLSDLIFSDANRKDYEYSFGNFHNGSLSEDIVNECFYWLVKQSDILTCRVTIHPSMIDRFIGVMGHAFRPMDSFDENYGIGSLWTSDVLVSDKIPANCMLFSAAPEYCGVVAMKEYNKVGNTQNLVASIGITNCGWVILEVE